MRKQLSSLLFLMLFSMVSLAIQAQKISGKITSLKEGSSLPGVSVQVKGTTTGTTSDADGNYSISASPNATLIFSYIGFKGQEIKVGNQTTINVALDEDAANLEEVVVTALGIKKEAKKLGYATSTVSAAAITENRSPNFMNTLQGKIAGVNISSRPANPKR